MKTVQCSEAKTHFLRMLDEVEGGETIVITRRGVRVARLVPDREADRRERDQVVTDIRNLGRQNGKITADELVAWKHEGHRY
ncbi:MAG: type II toxin-antitoxin system Phd/YefM family antitoxin [Acidobacteria bacterium]|nr:MAG: type II toxin-antitoxin system Phd/YefM family antitoxin [Acidobacteriota bacterium]